jgi:hypothetical protein
MFMKRPIKADKPITKDDLQAVLTKYPTKKDLQEALKDYPTKKDLSETLNISFAAFRNEIGHMFTVQNEQWEQRFAAFASQMHTLIDPLVKEMETRQQDREIATAQYKELQRTDAYLDRRVTKLERAK